MTVVIVALFFSLLVEVLKTDYLKEGVSMRHELLTDKELAEVVKEKVESDDWFVVQGNNSQSFIEFCTLIENKFYEPGTERNEGFEVVLPVFVVFLRKEELSERVIAFLESKIEEQEEEFSEKF
ncbi:hypothetical protein AKJ56_01340 [candidate division MSBL1 archaeon SCGC-AAA382N08]|uniref:Uncharacterized protein n=1 Tax=candidate division MSBL1 archaeon SCGC-AAA382N08 TaxID=1698285 RepID=A0A133VPQ2_9EURY|nr:hypothetical protein AKJ56_01340 [candidate division MSBL1 archaeon SCGC-AAA382N08]